MAKKKEENNNIVNIIIRKKIADDTTQIYAQFEAEEIVMDGVRTLFNEGTNFREDSTVREHTEIKEFKDMLEKEKPKTKEEKTKLIREAIIATEKNLTAARKKDKNKLTSDEKETKSKIKVTGSINILDEQARLIKLKICENVIKYDGIGSYITFLPNGRKQYEYTYEDGLLYPMKILIMEHAMYPNEGSMVRIHRSWVSRLAEDLAGTNMDQWGKIWMVIMIIATVLAFFGGTVFLINAANDAKEVPIMCSEAMIDVSKQVADIARSVNVRIPVADALTNESITRQVQKT